MVVTVVVVVAELVVEDVVVVVVVELVVGEVVVDAVDEVDVVEVTVVIVVAETIVVVRSLKKSIYEYLSLHKIISADLRTVIINSDG